MNWLFEVFCKVSIFVNHRFNKSYKTILASHVAHLVKNPCAMQETWVQFLGWEDPLEKGTATHSSIPAWRIPCGRKELDMTEQLSLSLLQKANFKITLHLSPAIPTPSNLALENN